jgi:hypothetical protein
MRFLRFSIWIGSVYGFTFGLVRIGSPLLINLVVSIVCIFGLLGVLHCVAVDKNVQCLSYESLLGVFIGECNEQLFSYSLILFCYE